MTSLSKYKTISDAAPPTILVFTQNVTVAPGERFDIQCMAEGAPSPYVEISFKEDADLTPVSLVIPFWETA